MKKLACTIALVIIMAASVEAKNAAGKFLISPFGGVGMGLAGGEHPDYYDGVMGVGLAYNGGIMFGYAPISAGAVMFGFEYASKPFVFHHDHPTRGEYTVYRFTHFIDLTAGWRGYIKWFYYEAGLFWGFKILRWREHAEYKDKAMDDLYGYNDRIPEVNSDNDFGLFFGFGASIPLASFVSLDLGIKIETAIVAAYENPDVFLHTIPILFQMGFTFFI